MNFVLKHLLNKTKDFDNALIVDIEANQPLPEDVDAVFDVTRGGNTRSTSASEGSGIAGVRPPNEPEETGAALRSGQAVDVFYPKEGGTERLPVIVMVHGGGLFVGNRKMSRRFCARMAQMGFLVFATDYRLIDKADFFGMVADATHEFDLVDSLLDEFGGDRERVAVVAESAGAFVSEYAIALQKSKALQEAMAFEDGLELAEPLRPSTLPIRAFVCFGGMFYTTRKDPIGITYPRDLYGKARKDKAFKALTDPEDLEILDSLPPTFMVTSKGDFLKSYTKRMAKAMEKAGHPYKIVDFGDRKDLKHAFPAIHPDLPESLEVRQQIAAWLREI